MTRTYVPVALRRAVAARARDRCEYCPFPSALSLFSFEVEHIIAERHGGETVTGNLALACPFCNRAKGTDLASLDPDTGALTPFFNPRTDKWPDHFRMDASEIVPLTAVGRVTVAMLRLNAPDRQRERALLDPAQLGL